MKASSCRYVSLQKRKKMILNHKQLSDYKMKKKKKIAY